MRAICLSLFFFLFMDLQGQETVDTLEVRKYVDSINRLVDIWTSHDPVLSVDISGEAQILHGDGSRFLFNMYDLKGDSREGEGSFKGITIKIYDPRTRPAEQHFIYFRASGSSGGLIRFDHIPEKDLRHIFDLCVSLRRLFL